MNDKTKFLLCMIAGLLIMALSLGFTASKIKEDQQKKYVHEVVTSNMQCKEYLIKIDSDWQKVVSCERKEQ